MASVICHPQDVDENGLLVLASSSMTAIPNRQQLTLMPTLAGPRARALCWHHMADTHPRHHVSDRSKATVRVSRALILPCPYHMHELTAGIKTR